MRRILRQRANQDDVVKLFGDRKPKARKPLTDLQAFGVVMSLFVALGAVGVAAFAVLAWLAWDEHEFGENDPRYLVFVRGTLIERIGVIDAQPGTVVYRGQSRDGNAPPFLRARYTSSIGASELFERFAARCRELSLQVRPREQPSSDGARLLSCGVEGKDDFHAHISVRAARPTEVLMGEEFEDGF